MCASVRRFGLAFTTIVCAEIATVMLWCVVGGEMTGFDALWLLGVVGVGTRVQSPCVARESGRETN